ncbi:MAG: hypothetical protein Q4Q22_02690 [Methanosphaera sp.]|nr:hypothetical protein [Methanosphaera sp.]
MTDYEDTILEITHTLTQIIRYLNELTIKHDADFFSELVNIYGLINYSRNQFLPKTSTFITDNHAFNDIFFNYTSVESMILDLFMIMESDIIKTLDKNDIELLDIEKTETILAFAINLLELLEKIINTRIRLNDETIDNQEYTRLNQEYTNEIFKMQNDFYKLVYDEKIDFRVK